VAKPERRLRVSIACPPSIVAIAGGRVECAQVDGIEIWEMNKRFGEELDSLTGVENILLGIG